MLDGGSIMEIKLESGMQKNGLRDSPGQNEMSPEGGQDNRSDKAECCL